MDIATSLMMLGDSADEGLGWGLLITSSSITEVVPAQGNDTFQNGSFHLLSANIIAKISPEGSLEAIKEYSTEATSHCAIDTSGNIWVLSASKLIKLSSSLAVSLVKDLSVSGTLILGGISVSGTDVFIHATNSTTVDKRCIAKLNSAGTEQWQTNVTVTGNYLSGRGITSDASGNTYLASYFYFSGQGHSHIAKLNSSGAIVYQLPVLDPTNKTYTAMAVNSQGEVLYNSSVGRITLITAAGAFSQSRTYSGTHCKAIVTDSSDNVYALLKAGTTVLGIYKFSSDLSSVTWYKQVTFTNGTAVNPSCMSLDAGENFLYISAQVTISTGDNGIFVLKMNLDGDGNGSYTDFTLTDGTQSTNTGSLSTTTSSYTYSAGTDLSISTGSDSVSAVSTSTNLEELA